MRTKQTVNSVTPPEYDHTSDSTGFMVVNISLKLSSGACKYSVKTACLVLLLTNASGPMCVPVLWLGYNGLRYGPDQVIFFSHFDSL